MAEEVDIGNVGGEGVASEVTLAKLTTAIENMARASGVDPRSAAAKLQEQYNKSLGETDDITSKYSNSLKDLPKETKKATKSIKKLGQASMNAVGGLLGSVAGGFAGLAKEFVAGGNNLSNFSQHIPIVGGLLGGFAGYIDNTVSTFRTLSATGAAFGNDMMETRRDLDLQKFFDVAKLGSGNSAALNRIFDALLKGDSTGFKFTAINSVKDLTYIQDLLEDFPEAEKIAEDNKNYFQKAVDDGYGENFISELIDKK